MALKFNIERRLYAQKGNLFYIRNIKPVRGPTVPCSLIKGSMCGLSHSQLLHTYIWYIDLI